MLFWGVLIYTTAVRCGIWEKSNILILRSIVCEMPFCCPKRATVSAIRRDFLGVEDSHCWMRLLSGGGGRGGGKRGSASQGGVVYERGPHHPLGSCSHSILCSVRYRNVSEHRIVTGSEALGNASLLFSLLISPKLLTCCRWLKLFRREED